MKREIKEAIAPFACEATPHLEVDISKPVRHKGRLVKAHPHGMIFLHKEKADRFRCAKPIETSLERCGKEIRPRVWMIEDARSFVAKWPRAKNHRPRPETWWIGMEVGLRIGGMLVSMRLPNVRRLVKACDALGVDRVTITNASPNKAMRLKVGHKATIHLMPAMITPDTKFIGFAKLNYA